MRYTIITVSYNSYETIERTIKSVLAQEVKDYEYIIVDGASTDGTMEIVKRYEPLFEGRMRWISEKDDGIYSAMNKGIKMAKGNLIGLCNSDDMMQPDTLTILNDYINSNKIDLNNLVALTGWMNFCYSDGSSQVIKRNKRDFERHIHNLSVYANHPATWVSIEAYHKTGLFDENIKITSDIDMMYRLYKEGVDFMFIDKILTNMYDGGATNNKLKPQHYHDRKYVINKHIASSIRKKLMLCEWITIMAIKQLIPEKMFKYYRYFKSK